MPNTQKRSEPPTEEEKARIVTGPDPDRFYCPHPGCNRSFAELWRLKVHFRAPPDVRGSGKERGHGTELQFCPKCGKDLRPGKHHVGCSAGKSAPRQAAKRQRQQQMSTTTESAGHTTGTTEQTTASWELTARRPAVSVKQQTEAESAQRAKRPATDAAAGGRTEGMENGAALGAGGPGEHQQMLYAMPGSAAAAVAGAGVNGCDNNAGMHHMGGQHYGSHPFQQAAGGGGGMLPPHAQPQQQQHAQQQQQHAQHSQLPHLDLPQHPAGEHRPHSPSPLDLFGDPFAGGTNGHGGGGFGGGGGGGGNHHHTGGGVSNLFVTDDEDDMLRIPSPPPLPADWETNAVRPGMLFDFDQFDASKRQQQQAGCASAPLVTVTTAMNPVDVFNPSDDYIWQILFAGENDAVPKRVTAHLHHPPATALSYLDDTDPLLDAILADDLPAAPGHAMTEAAVQREQHGSFGSGGSGGTVPVAGDASGSTGHQFGSHHMHHQHQHQHGGMMLPSLDSVFGQQQVVPQHAPHQRQHQQQHHHQMQHQQQQQAMGVPQPYRNSYGSHHGGGMGGVPTQAMKLEGAAATAANGFIL